MAGFPRGQSFNIFSDSSNSNSENQHAFFKKTKREEKSLKPPAQKRAALGEISNNTRVQPLRAAKQGQSSEGFGAVGCENAVAKNARAKTQQYQFPPQPFTRIGQAGQASGSFKVHVDRTLPAPAVANVRPIVKTVLPEESDSEESPELGYAPQRRGLVLHPSVTALVASSPMQPIVIDDDDDDDDDYESSELEDSPMLLDTSECQALEKRKQENSVIILTVPQYSVAIYLNLLKLEARFCAGPYMKKQADINCNMRSILVDWLVEVAEEYKLHRETLMLAVNYIDRFLSKMAVNRKKLQLVGAACMFLASKYEEIYPPEASEFVYITDNTYTKEEVLKMEHLILKVLAFDLGAPTINVFCEKFLNDAGVTQDDQVYYITLMLSEWTLLDSDTYLKFMPSQIAASCMLLANHTVGRYPAWPAHVEQFTRYSARSLSLCVQALFHTYSQAANHPQQATFDKYKASKMKEVALIPPPRLLPTCCVMTPFQS